MVIHRNIEGTPIVKLIQDNLSNDDSAIDLDSDVSESEVSSLAIMRFHKLVNTEFGIDMPIEEFTQFTTLRGLIEQIEGRVG